MIRRRKAKREKDGRGRKGVRERTAKGGRGREKWRKGQNGDRKK
jgi:hypothetical protein